MGRLILVRHGQASFGAADYDRLSPLGVEQARTTGAALAARGPGPDLLLQGRLRRHEQTTRSLLEGAGWAGVPVRTLDGWDEIDHLRLMACYDETPAHHDPRAFQAAYERALHRWMADPSEPAGHEPFTAFAARVLEALRLAAEESGPGRTVVVVTSAGPISMACASLMQAGRAGADRAEWLRWNAVAVNCAQTTVLVGRSGARLLSFNEHGHLAPTDVTFR